MSAPLHESLPADELELVAGPVLFADDPGTAAELAGSNLAVTHAPAVVVGAESSADVVSAVRYAATRGLPVAVHATGHGGTSYRAGVVVTTRRLTTVEVDPVSRTARVGAGVRWRQVIAAAAVHGLAPLNGSSPDVGVVGYTLGGGVGPLARQYGFAADHVRSIELVTADGRLRTVDGLHDPDLFWALRGGKGSFGVVTALELDLFPVARLYGGALVFAGSDANTVLRAYRRWVDTLPDATTTSVALLKLPQAPHVPAPLRGTVTVHVRIAHAGTADEGEALVAPMRAVATPLIDSVAEMPYTAVGSIHNDPSNPLPSWHDGALVRDLTDEGIDALLAAAEPWFTLPFALVEIRHLGGALGRQPAQPNAVDGRDAGFLLGVVGLLDATGARFVRAAGGEVIASLSPWACDVLPVNYLAEVRSPDRVGRGWSPATYQRLLQVKALYDPRNLFRSGYAVLPGASYQLGSTIRL
jgi:FAD/FMN-containing dehydrogenase